MTPFPTGYWTPEQGLVWDNFWAGKNGILEEIGAVDAMAARLVQVLADPAKAEAFGRAAREAAENQFRTDLVVPMYEAVYERALAKR